MRAVAVARARSAADLGGTRQEPPTVPPTWALALLEEVRAIRARLETIEARRMPQSRVSRSQRELLEKVMPVVAGAKGSTWFVVAELFTDASPALCLVLFGVSRRSLGKALARAADTGEVIGGFVVERAAPEAGAVVWRVMWAL